MRPEELELRERLLEELKGRYIRKKVELLKKLKALSVLLEADMIEEFERELRRGVGEAILPFDTKSGLESLISEFLSLHRELEDEKAILERMKRG